ncbi:Oidioi.mRNA.OKI2018_I69.PAR.g10716.t1.cds [Oikopleura dioica]|uniref:Oidioi.mRNA.OKI2018_I69.PAR.g10716.t1.cds n=1 Tax=Oikopleura dioica TaxID=34765 RepID=A0ABN7RXM4_OIKDI|nr:Oidioi.mRNA.OKI2018_I69.PAR.g10716.t1.cds [Oikopleura dioica]
MKNIEAAIRLEFIRLHMDLVDVRIFTDRFSMKMMNVKPLERGSLKLINYLKVTKDFEDIDGLLEKRPENSEVFFLTESRLAHKFLLIPVASDDGRASEIQYNEVTDFESPGSLLFSTVLTERNENSEINTSTGNHMMFTSMPDALSRRRYFEEIPDRVEIPDWIEEEDRKSREKKQHSQTKPKRSKKKQTTKNKSRSNNPVSYEEINSRNTPAKSEDKNTSLAELGLDDVDGSDWLTVGDSKQAKSERSSRKVRKSPNPGELTEEKLSSVSKEEDASEILSSEEPVQDDCVLEEEPENDEIRTNAEQETDAALKKENSALKERLESLLMCQICYEAYDEANHAKYSHACGHGCCWTCMKKEFARQREAKKKKFYCHCGFEIHEKKIIRMFI